MFYLFSLCYFFCHNTGALDNFNVVTCFEGNHKEGLTKIWYHSTNEPDLKDRPEVLHQINQVIIKKIIKKNRGYVRKKKTCSRKLCRK